MREPVNVWEEMERRWIQKMLDRCQSAEEVLGFALSEHERVRSSQAQCRLWEVVARESPHLDVRLALHVCSHGQVGHLLLHNPQVSPEIQKEVADFLSAGLAEVQATQLGPLAEAGWLPPESAAARRLLEMLDRGEKRAPLAASLWCRIARNEDSARRFVEHLRSRETRLAVARYPAAHPEVYRELLRQAEWEVEMLEALACSRVARADAEVRSALHHFGRWRSVRILAELAQEAEGEFFVQLYQEALQLGGAGGAARVLARAGEEAVALLPRPLLLPLLQSEEAECRLLALRSMGRGEESEEVPSRLAGAEKTA